MNTLTTPSMLMLCKNTIRIPNGSLAPSQSYLHLLTIQNLKYRCLLLQLGYFVGATAEQTKTISAQNQSVIIAINVNLHSMIAFNNKSLEH